MFLAKEAVNQIGAIREFEKPKVSEAIKVANANKLMVCLSPMEWNEREARLKKEYEKNTKAPGPGEEQPKENGLKAATDAFILQANEIMRLKKKNAELLEAIDKMKEGNPALKEASSQFNDALLDEQAKKIAELTKENEDLKSWHEMQNRGIALSNIAFRDEKKRLGKEISKLNGIIHKKNLKIEELEKESSRHLEGKVKMFGENVDLEQMLKDKDAILSDVAEELRLTKIREKNLVEVSQKYMKENEGLKEQLADNVVDKINANALKSAESALAWKEKVVTYKDMALAYYEKKIAEKDDVIADLGKELAATKKELEAFKESYKRRIKEDSEHFEHIQKICNAGQQKWLIESEYLEKDKPFRFPQQPELSEEELMKLQEKVCVDNAEEGKDHSGVIVLCGKDYIDALKKVKDVWQE